MTLLPARGAPRADRRRRRPGLVLVPSAGGTFEKLDKKWPRFAELAQRLLADPRFAGRDIVMAPGPDEVATARAVCTEAKLLEKLDLGSRRRAAARRGADSCQRHRSGLHGSPVGGNH